MKQINQTKKRRLLLFTLATTLSLGIFNACVPDFKDPSITLKPELYVPIASGVMQLDDIIRLAYDDTTLKYAEDGTMLISFKQDDIYKATAGELLGIPNDFKVDSMSLNFENSPTADLSFTHVFPFGQTMSDILGIDMTEVEGLEGTLYTIPETQNNVNKEYPITDDNLSVLESVILEEGTMDITISNGFATAIGLNVIIFNEATEQTIANVEIDKIEKGESVTKSYNIAGIELGNNLKVRIGTATAYASDGEVTFHAADELKLDFKLKNLAFSASGEDIFNVDFEEGYHLTSMGTKNAQLQLVLESEIAADLEISVELPDITTNGVPKTFTIIKPATTIKVIKEVDISNSIVDFTGQNPEIFNQIRFKYTVKAKTIEAAEDFVSSKKVVVSVLLNNIQFDYLEGSIETQTLTMQSGTADFPLEFLSKLSGSISFSDPKLKFNTSSSFGLNNALNMQFVGFNANGNGVNLNPPTFSLEGPTYPNNEIITSQIVIDKDNSNLLNFFNSQNNTSIQYSGTFTINPAGASPTRIEPDAEMTIGYEVELPMRFKTSGLSFSKKFAVENLDFADLESATMILRYKNKLPLNIVLNMSFLDTTLEAGSQELEKLEAISLKAAPTDENGKVTSEGEAMESAQTISTEMLDKIANANAIRVKGTFMSGDEGIKQAQLFLNDYIDLKFLVKAKFNLTSN